MREETGLGGRAAGAVASAKVERGETLGFCQIQS